MGQYHQQVVAVIDKLTPYCNTLSNDNSLQFTIAAFIVNRGDYVHNIICDAVTTFDPGTCVILYAIYFVLYYHLLILQVSSYNVTPHHIDGKLFVDTKTNFS